MRKLNNNEIQALSNKIYKELNIPNPADVQKELKADYTEKYLKLVKDFDTSEEGKVLKKYKCKVYAEKVLKSISGSEIKGLYSNGFNRVTIKTPNNSCINTFIIVIDGVENKYPKLSDISQEIILAQIETKDLKELISKVKDMFK